MAALPFSFFSGLLDLELHDAAQTSPSSAGKRVDLWRRIMARFPVDQPIAFAVA
ncbi:MAG: hypothetical protein R2991_10660 [Thermoanaerobaculia bacterium]